MSLGGEANLLSCTQTDSRRGGRIVRRLRGTEGRIYHKGRRPSPGQKTCVALLFRQPITMERQQRGFWESGGAQVRWPLPGMARNYMAVCRHKGSRGKQKWAGFFIRKERKKRVKSGRKMQNEKQSKIWREVENARKRRRRRRPTRPQTSMAVLKLNEMEGRSIGKAAKRHKEVYTSEEGKMIPAVNFLYIARKSTRRRRGGRAPRPRAIRRSKCLEST